MILDGWECLRCKSHHRWLNTREKKPVRCPACGSPYWDTPKKEEVINKSRIQ